MPIRAWRALIEGVSTRFFLRVARRPADTCNPAARYWRPNCWGLVGFALELAEPPFVGIWIGASFLTFPAYIAGIGWQVTRSRELLTLHSRLLLRLGGISLVLSLVALLLLREEPTSRWYVPNGESELLIVSSVEIRTTAELARHDECRFSRAGRKNRTLVYRCRIPENSRDVIRLALVSGAWETMPVPPNALVAYRRNRQVALFVCKWNADRCELWLQRDSPT
jgi:hypothetical protein